MAKREMVFACGGVLTVVDGHRVGFGPFTDESESHHRKGPIDLVIWFSLRTIEKIDGAWTSEPKRTIRT